MQRFEIVPIKISIFQKMFAIAYIIFFLVFYSLHQFAIALKELPQKPAISLLKIIIAGSGGYLGSVVGGHLGLLITIPLVPLALTIFSTILGICLLSWLGKAVGACLSPENEPTPSDSPPQSRGHIHDTTSIMRMIRRNKEPDSCLSEIPGTTAHYKHQSWEQLSQVVSKTEDPKNLKLYNQIQLDIVQHYATFYSRVGRFSVNIAPGSYPALRLDGRD